jgi:hypothetical protein
MTELLGWTATAAFLISYGCKDQKRLRLVQAGAALLWTGYGVLIASTPVIVANLLVAGVAIYSSLNRPADRRAVPDQALSPRAPGAALDLSRTSSPCN